MPGMMNTILNLGLTDASVEGLAKKTGNPRFAYDGYRRLIDMFGSTAMGVEHELFEHELEALKNQRGVKLDTDLNADDLKELVKRYKAVYEKHVKAPFPQDPKDQLWRAIMAVFNSWMGNKAVEYRRIERITGLKGTAVNVQAMVFGNTGNNSGTGVAFTRDPNTGENVFFGDYLINAQGEDVVAGIRTPEPISQLGQGDAQGLRPVARDPQEARDALQGDAGHRVHGRRTARSTCSRPARGKRTGTAAVRIAVEMVKEGLIDEKTAIKRVSPDSLNHLLLPQLDPKAKKKPVARGIAASPGAASGKVDPLGRGGRRVPRSASQRADPAGAEGDQPRGRRRHAPGQGHPHGDRRQGQPRGGRRAGLGQALRRRLRRDPDRREGRQDHDRAARRSRPATTSRSTARPATS